MKCALTFLILITFFSVSGWALKQPPEPIYPSHSALAYRLGGWCVIGLIASLIGWIWVIAP